MLQQTKRILNIQQPTFGESILNKIEAIKRFFTNEDKYDAQSPKQQEGQNNSSFTQKSSIFSKSFQKCQTLIHSSITESLKFTDFHPNEFWSRITYFYQNHRIDEAYAELQNFENYRERAKEQVPISLLQQRLGETVKFEYRTMIQLYEHFSDTGYIFDKEQKGINLWYKIVDQKYVSVKVSAEIDITIQNFICISSQVELFQLVFPFTYGTKQLKVISRNQRIGTSKVHIPLLTDRQTYFYAAAYDRLRTKNSIFFFSKTMNQDEEYQKRYEFEVPQMTDYVRLDYKYYIMEYVPLTKTRGKITMISSIDLKMDFLPLFLINRSARIFCFQYICNLIKINKKFEGSEWDKMKTKKKELYDYFQQKIDEYIQSKDQVKAQE